ncbi:NADH oxidase [Ceratobasidium theobromae]|uniref:NADH oxidase n=1 Tax=Ceratobasidium theobromae TaxID=1582974 RepID=A0A5N5QUM2_9AGAM|nr:NADH oxidase [Ceratobasidium theobromae]
MDSLPSYTRADIFSVGISAEVSPYGTIPFYKGRKSFSSAIPFSHYTLIDEERISEPAYCLQEGARLAFSGKVVPNRLVKAPMTERVCVFDRETEIDHGKPNKALLKLYEEWSHGQYGIVITGNILVDKDHLEAIGNPILDRNLPTRSSQTKDGSQPHPYTSAYAALASHARKHSPSSLIIAQLNHPGAHSSDQLTPTPLSPSGVRAAPAMGETFNQPRALSEAEIWDVIDRFAYAAQTLYFAGFDGVQLHAAHGYLLTQFLSPLTNLRTDSWGGPPEGRAKIILEIVDAIKRVCPPSFSISVKLNSHDFLVGGFTPADSLVICGMLERRGVDFIEVSGGTYDSMVEAFTHARESTRKREAHFIEFSEQLRRQLSKTKVVLTGGFKTADGMACAIEDGACDFVGLARTTAAEPRLGASLLASRTTKARSTLIPDHIGLQVGAALVQIRDIAEGREPTDFASSEASANFLKSLGVAA